MKLKLNNKIILITGVGKGIGKEILHKLLKEDNIIYAVTRNINDLNHYLYHLVYRLLVQLQHQ